MVEEPTASDPKGSPTDAASADDDPQVGQTAGDPDKAMADAIAIASPTALETGEAVNWSSGSRHGYVVVSAQQERGGRPCRNAYWTLITPNNQIQGPTTEWCNQDGRWVARDRP
ncbi:MAG: hypothetical protein ABIS51_23365 [Sphingomonas sp.]